MNSYNATLLHDLVEQALAKLTFPKKPAGLYEPIRYELSLGGKRIRPVFFLLAAQMYMKDGLTESNMNRALPWALALEVFHNYTLLHDDVMDNSPLRRGKPTVHKKWNANTAILSGDAMLLYASQLLADFATREDWPLIVQDFVKMGLQVMEGQQYDMNFEERVDVTLPEYMEMIRLKTGVLIAKSLKDGAWLGNADRENLNAVYLYGELVGRAFQLQDDYLDVFGNSKVFGKPIGGDIVEGKKTYLLISAFQKAEPELRTEMMDRLGKNGDAEEKIKYFTGLYKELGIADDCSKEIASCYKKADVLLDSLKCNDEARELLRDYSNSLINRTF